jgi:hypothetical protein
MDVKYGNREGKYYTEWRFNLLLELLEMVHVGPMPGKSDIVDVQDPEIWYDADEDYHRLKFIACGKVIEVQLYKVFGCYIDGQPHWPGCPKNQVWNYANSIRRKLGIKNT